MSRPVIAKDWFTKEAQEKPRQNRMLLLLDQAKVTKAEHLPQFLSAREAAPYLKVVPKTAGEMMRSQIVRSAKLRGRRYTTPEWIADYLRKELKAHG